MTFRLEICPIDVELIAETVETETTTASPLRWASPEFGAIYEEHSKPIFYLTLRMLRDPSAAEDATHDVFLKAFHKMNTFRNESNIRTWLYRIAINHCHNIAKSWHNRHIQSSDDAQLLDRGATEANPLRVLETKELGQRIQNTLDALPEEYRLLLLLLADEKLSYEEIAALTGQTSDAVRGKLHRARKTFQIHFKKTE
ncbi:MAG: sigma-70 family RNA polymerase sigma factor [Verrucomicrobiota bacterium]